MLLALSSDRGITKGGVADRGYAAKALYSVKSMDLALLEEEDFRHPPEPRGGERGGGLGEAEPPANRKSKKPLHSCIVRFFKTKQ